MIKIESKGDFSKTMKYLEKLEGSVSESKLDTYGRMGVEALSANSPVLTGLMASSWYYTIDKTDTSITLTWCNSDIEGGANVAIMVDQGHGTRSGHYIAGKNFITPALEPVFNKIIEELRKEV
jgi:hypothetical protein